MTHCQLWFRCPNSTPPEYLARDLQWALALAVDDDSRKRLRSASSHKLVVRRSSPETVRNRVCTSSLEWNGLPSDVTSAELRRPSKTLEDTSFTTVIYLTVHVFYNLLEASAYGRLNLSLLSLLFTRLPTSEAMFRRCSFYNKYNNNINP